MKIRQAASEAFAVGFKPACHREPNLSRAIVAGLDCRTIEWTNNREGQKWLM